MLQRQAKIILLTSKQCLPEQTYWIRQIKMYESSIWTRAYWCTLQFVGNHWRRRKYAAFVVFDSALWRLCSDMVETIQKPCVYNRWTKALRASSLIAKTQGWVCTEVPPKASPGFLGSCPSPEDMYFHYGRRLRQLWKRLDDGPSRVYPAFCDWNQISVFSVNGDVH